MLHSVHARMIVHTYCWCAVPGQPIVSVDYTTATSISLSWSVPTNSVVDGYEVVWITNDCPHDVDEGSVTVTETSYIMMGLREGTSYTIIVSATNLVGSSTSDSVTDETEEIGILLVAKFVIPYVLYTLHLQLHPLLPLL